jgi:hypothetical protein
MAPPVVFYFISPNYAPNGPGCQAASGTANIQAGIISELFTSVVIVTVLHWLEFV